MVIAVALFASIVSSVSVVQKKFSHAQVEAEAEAMVEIEFDMSSLSSLVDFNMTSVSSLSKMLVSKTVTCGLCKPTITAVKNIIKSRVVRQQLSLSALLVPFALFPLAWFVQKWLRQRLVLSILKKHAL